MRSKNCYISLVFLLTISIAFAQRGIDGNRVVSAAGTIYNEYTTLSADAASGATSITVAASGLNANNRFGAGNTLAAGDLILIIQMQGATILGEPDIWGTPAISNPNDATWGTVTNYNNCGRYEYAQVASVPNATTITIDCGLTYSYTAAGKVQVIRVPRCNTLTVNNPGTLTCQTWNGTTGGVVAIEVYGNTIINAGGKMTASGTGFRGGALFTPSPRVSTTLYSCISNDVGTNKGEGIAGYDTDYTANGGKYCRGAPANAGGGANIWNCGGGGGANAGNTAAWNGQGNPDNSLAAWTTAWNLESPGFATSTSSGGGRGGYSYSNTNLNATVVGPGNTSWGGSYRENRGGLGGRPLDYSTGRIYMGGGGGAGEQDNGFGGAGGRGGGIIFLNTYGNITGTGTDSILANGANGTSTNISGFNTGVDGAGGAGGGGTIILNARGTVSGVYLQANGGTGGVQRVQFSPSEAEGPGGGGGGGYIAVSNGTPPQQALGGANGTTQAAHLSEFIPNGATRGGAGLTAQPITKDTITASGVTICSGNTATLTASLIGTIPATITWYNAAVGGSVLGTGTSYTTPVLGATTTYYVGFCPGTYTIPVTVTVTPGPSITVNSPTICSGAAAVLTAAGGTTYAWSTGASGNPISVSPASTTSYTVTGTTSGCSSTAVATVTVTPGPPITVNSPSICSGATATLTASGGTTYNWSTGSSLNPISVSPGSTTSYTVTGTTGGCSSTAVATVTVTPGPSVTVNSPSICSGNSANLTAAGATSYSWSTGSSLNPITVSPGATTSYTVTGTTAGCTGTAIAIVTVTSNPTITVNSPSICSGSTAVLTASGGTTYDWSTGSSSNPISVSPAATTSYTVTGTTGGCSSTAVATVTVTASPSITVNSPSICAGASATLTAAGGTSYLWSTGSSSNPVSVSPAATTSYTVTGTTGGCSSTAVAMVTVTANPSITVNSPSICAGASATLTAAGGTSYLWSTGSSSNPISVSPAATTSYTVTGTTGGCSSTAVATVTVTANPTITVNSPSICAGASATLTAAGGTSYLWSTGSSSNPVSVSPAATTSYTVTGTTGGCSSSAIATVTVSASPAVTVNSPAICPGATATLTAAGATTYVWSTGSSSNPISVSPGATTSYTVTGTTGSCSASAIATVTVSSSLSITVNSPTICAGSSAVLTAAGGASYSWSTGSSLNPITVSPGATTSYTVTGTSGSCSATAVATVTVTSLPSVTVNSPTICAGDTAVLTASGAAAYNWSTGSSINPIAVNPAAATSYTVTGTTSGCSATAVSVVTVTALPSITVNSPTICSGAAAVLTAAGGSTYAWSTSASGNPISVTPVATTSYTVTGTAAGCSSTAIATVTVTPNPVITVNSPSICEGATATLTAAGGTTYDWSTSASVNPISVTPLSTTSYTVTGTTGGCSSTAISTVTVSPNPTISVNSPTICEGATATLTAAGGSTYDWSTSATGNTISVSPSSTTSYTVTGTDAGCSATAVSTVTVLPMADPTIDPVSPVCSSSPAFNLSAAQPGGTWSGTGITDAVAGTFTPPGAGNYTITYTISGSCGGSDTVVITVNPSLSALINNLGPVCEGGVPFNFTAANPGGTWSGTGITDTAAGTFTPGVAGAGTFIITYTLPGACGNTDTALIVVNPNSDATITQPPVLCVADPPVTLVAATSGGLWMGTATTGAGVFSPGSAGPGSFLITYMIGGSCGSSDTVMITVSGSADASITSPGSLCVGDTAFNLSAATSGGIWSGTGITDTLSGTFSPGTAGAGTHSIVYTIGGFCGGSDVILITVDPPLNVTITPQSPLCPGSAPITFSAATAGGTWSGTGITDTAAGTFSPGVAGLGSHLITYTIGGPCGNTDTVILTIVPPVTAVISTVSPVCADAAAFSLSASPSGGTWSGTGIINASTGLFDPSAALPGTATVIYGISGGCGDTTSTSFIINALPVPGISSDVTSGCAPLCVNFTETVGTTCSAVAYNFGDGNTSTASSPTNCYALPGMYSVSITCTDVNGCTGTTNVANMIEVYPVPVAQFTISPSTIVSSNTVVTFTDISTGGNNSFWEFGDTASGSNYSTLTIAEHAYLNEGVYCVTLASVSTNGCADTTSMCLTVANESVISVPNIFTPNGDGVNDVFFVTSTSVGSLTCSVYDRWGLKLAQWDEVNGGWDGRTTTGNVAPNGVYYYILRAVGNNEEVMEQQGFFQLLSK